MSRWISFNSQPGKEGCRLTLACHVRLALLDVHVQVLPSEVGNISVVRQSLEHRSRNGNMVYTEGRNGKGLFGCDDTDSQRVDCGAYVRTHLAGITNGFFSRAPYISTIALMTLHIGCFWAVSSP